MTPDGPAVCPAGPRIRAEKILEAFFASDRDYKRKAALQILRLPLASASSFPLVLSQKSRPFVLLPS